MMPITQKIYKTLKQENIKEQEMLTVLRNVYHDLESHSESKVTVEELYFNIMKDVIWYNFERQKNADTLKDFGTKYKNIMFCCDEDNCVPLDKVGALREELKEVRKKLTNNDVLLTQLVGNEESFDNDTKVHYLDKRKQTLIPYSKKPQGAITCIIKESLNSFKMEQIKINSVIDTLLTAIEKAEENKSNVIVEFI